MEKCESRVLDPGPSEQGRRAVMRGGASAVAAAYGFTPGVALARGVPNQSDGSRFARVAAEPNPKHGGAPRCLSLWRQPHFDAYQAGTFSNPGSRALMFGNLIRRCRRSAGRRATTPGTSM